MVDTNKLSINLNLWCSVVTGFNYEIKIYLKGDEIHWVCEISLIGVTIGYIFD